MEQISVFDFEVKDLHTKLETFNRLKEEITDLGKEANEQGSETFGHDNPILEAKHEKDRMLSIMQPEIKRIEQLLQNCLTVSESEIKNKVGIMSIGSIVTYSIDEKETNKVLVVGVLQGKKVKFRGEEYTTISHYSPIWKGLGGKKIGESTNIYIGGKERKIKVLDIQ